MHRLAIAQQIRQMQRDDALRRLEDGPIGGNTIFFGDDKVGQAIDAPLPAGGGWKLARIVDLSPWLNALINWRARSDSGCQLKQKPTCSNCL